MNRHTTQALSFLEIKSHLPLKLEGIPTDNNKTLIAKRAKVGCNILITIEFIFLLYSLFYTELPQNLIREMRYKNPSELEQFMAFFEDLEKKESLVDDVRLLFFSLIKLFLT